MRDFEIEEDLERQLKELVRKDKVLSEAVMNKIEEIVNCADVHHYKNLRAPMQNFKRVHVGSSFVLIFKYDLTKNKISFCDLDHHDNIYL